MVVEQTLFGTTFLSDGYKIKVLPILSKTQTNGCTIQVERDGYENSLTLSKSGINELIGVLEKYSK